MCNTFLLHSTGLRLRSIFATQGAGRDHIGKAEVLKEGRLVRGVHAGEDGSELVNARLLLVMWGHGPHCG